MDGALHCSTDHGDMLALWTHRANVSRIVRQEAQLMALGKQASVGAGSGAWTLGKQASGGLWQDTMEHNVRTDESTAYLIKAMDGSVWEI